MYRSRDPRPWAVAGRGQAAGRRATATRPSARGRPRSARRVTRSISSNPPSAVRRIARPPAAHRRGGPTGGSPARRLPAQALRRAPRRRRQDEQEAEEPVRASTSVERTASTSLPRPGSGRRKREDREPVAVRTGCSQMRSRRWCSRSSPLTRASTNGQSATSVKMMPGQHDPREERRRDRDAEDRRLERRPDPERALEPADVPVGLGGRATTRRHERPVDPDRIDLEEPAEQGQHGRSQEEQAGRAGTPGPARSGARRRCPRGPARRGTACASAGTGTRGGP